MALSSFRFASSPDFTVSTLWPSRRSAISSISQMERSSSQTRILPMGHLRGSSQGMGFLRDNYGTQGLAFTFVDRQRIFRSGKTAQPQNKFTSLPGLRTGPDLAFVRLHNLIYDRQAQARATFKLRLERLKDLLDQLRRNA